MVWKQGGIILQVSFVVCLTGAISAHADNVRNFYSKDSARNVFGNEVETTATPELGFEPAENTSHRSEKPALQPVALKPEVAGPEIPAMKVATTKNIQTPSDILKIFGDPDADITIPGRDDAPLPFKGMMAALETGDQALAQKYARQYVRYLKRVQSKTDKVMAIVSKAMGDEGMVKPPEAMPSEESDAEKLVNEAQDEAKLREDVRLAVKDKVPQDPFGQVDIYFFFRMEDEGSKLMLPEIESFYAAVSDDPNVKFIALSLDNVSREDIQEFRDTYKLTFPIRGGISLAKKLNVSGTPVTLLMTHNAPQKVVVEKGFRRSFYLEEVTQLMKGKGA